jgi:RES domain
VTLQLYRVFPWDAAATDGEPFSPEFIPSHQGSGRFDLRDGAVLYLGESPEHPVAEVLQGFRGREFQAGMLRRFRQPLALVEIRVPDELAERLVDLDDPAQLIRFSLRPSDVASDDRRRTTAIAAEVHESGATGLRWWSKLSGDWHAVVLFLERAPMARLTLGAPELLTPAHPAVLHACRHLGIALS